MHEQAGEADKSDHGGGGATAFVEEESSLDTVGLADRHRVGEFECHRSPRVQSFLRDNARKYEDIRYCRVFVYENPDDPDLPWGYYTLTSALLMRGETTNGHQKIIPGGIPVPLIRIGYIGRHDGAPKTLGVALIVDAARRVYRNTDIAAWGLMLDAENNNEKLVKWYESVGFKRAKLTEGVMYAPFKSLIPELNPQTSTTLKLPAARPKLPSPEQRLSS